MKERERKGLVRFKKKDINLMTMRNRTLMKYLPISVSTGPGSRGNATSQSFSKWIFLVKEFNAALLALYPPIVTGESTNVVILPAPEVMVMNFGVNLLAFRRGKNAWNKMMGAILLTWECYGGRRWCRQWPGRGEHRTELDVPGNAD